MNDKNGANNKNNTNDKNGTNDNNGANGKNGKTSKYLKVAIMLVFGSFLAVTVIFVLVLFALKGPSAFPTSPSTATVASCTQEQASAISLILVKNSPTFSYDGVKDSIRLVKAESPDNGQTWKLVYSFKTAHPGHGDRSDQVLAQVVTGHTAEVTVTKCKITAAVCDKTWDLLTNGQPK
jgi:hypothetical protein